MIDSGPQDDECQGSVFFFGRSMFVFFSGEATYASQGSNLFLKSQI